MRDYRSVLRASHYISVRAILLGRCLPMIVTITSYGVTRVYILSGLEAGLALLLMVVLRWVRSHGTGTTVLDLLHLGIQVLASEYI